VWNYGHGWGMMGDWGMGFGLIFWIVILVLLIAGVV